MQRIDLDNADTICLDSDARIIAEQCARGGYQRELVADQRRWSGADLRGKASHYSGHYAASRRALLRRLRVALGGAGCYKIRGSHDRRVVVLSSAPVMVRVEGPRNARVLVVEPA